MNYNKNPNFNKLLIYSANLAFREGGALPTNSYFIKNLKGLGEIKK